MTTINIDKRSFINSLSAAVRILRLEAFCTFGAPTFPLRRARDPTAKITRNGQGRGRGLHNFCPMALNLTLIMTLINLLMVGVFPAVCFLFFGSRSRSLAQVSIKTFATTLMGSLRRDGSWPNFPLLFLHGCSCRHSLIHADLLRFKFKFNKSHGFSTFLHNQESKN